MKIIAAGHRVEAELVAHLEKKMAKLSSEILHGVPVDVYNVRCAELRIMRDLLAELPAIIKKAKD